METNEKLLSAIFNVGRLIKEEMLLSNCLADFTQTEIEILKFLHGKKGTTMKSIADYLHIKPSSATPVIDCLVERGNLKRVQKKDDRRVVYIELTSKGLKSLQKKYKNIHKTIGKIFGKLNDNDKKILIEIFEKIYV
jgi:MarR family 2-MHQ and catechol resistance regulon transcriptional repressor